MRRAFALLAVITVTGATAGCSLGNKQATADRVIAAALRTEAAGVARADVTVVASVVPTKKPIAPGPPRIVGGAAVGLHSLIDFRAARAAIAIPGDDAALAAIVFDGSKMFQRSDIKPQPTPGAAGLPGANGPMSNLGLLSTVNGGPAATVTEGAQATATTTTAPATPPTTAPPTTAPPTTTAPRVHRSTKIQRRWLGLDFASLPKDDDIRTAGSYAINPAVIAHLAAGTLTGSIHIVGQEAVGGVTTTHYKMNISRDKAFRFLPEGAWKDLDKVFRANAIGRDVHAAEAWVDDKGMLRRFIVRFRQSLSSTDQADLRIGIELRDFGNTATIPLPDPKETATVPNLGQLVHGSAGT